MALSAFILLTRCKILSNGNTEIAVPMNGTAQTYHSPKSMIVDMETNNPNMIAHGVGENIAEGKE